MIRTKGSSGIVLDEYQGTYSITSVWENNAGEVKPNWCTVKRGKKGEETEKVLPIKIYLGANATEAVAVLQALLQEIGGIAPTPAVSGGGEDLDIPF